MCRIEAEVVKEESLEFRPREVSPDYAEAEMRALPRLPEVARPALEACGRKIRLRV